MARHVARNTSASAMPGTTAQQTSSARRATDVGSSEPGAVAGRRARIERSRLRDDTTRDGDPEDPVRETIEHAGEMGESVQPPKASAPAALVGAPARGLTASMVSLRSCD